MSSEFIPVATTDSLQESKCSVVRANGHTIALFLHEGEIHAVDNRCPHMGFPLDRGTVSDGILTCHWHHARFDLASGGTFDPWADDVRAYPVEVRDGTVFVDVSLHEDPVTHQRRRLQVGLERDLPLVIGKSVLVLGSDEAGAVEAFREGLLFGTRYRRGGWRQGLTMLTCFMNMLPYLEEEDRPRALYHGLSAAAGETFGAAPRFQLQPLPGPTNDLETLKRWFRRFIEVRDDEGAERCIVSAVRAGADDRAMADMLFAAATDHRYIDIGHPADFTNKALEALDIAGWQHAETVLTSLVMGYAAAERMEESNSWRHPVDLVCILENAFDELQRLDVHAQEPDAGQAADADLVALLHGDEPQAIADALLEALRRGMSAVQLAANVSYAAALRIARFHTSNEFSDWDTALHTFTFANAVEQGLRRAPSRELIRGVFDAAMSTYLDRFLNIPPAKLPEQGDTSFTPVEAIGRLPGMLDRQQQVNAAGTLVADFLFAGGAEQTLLATLGHLLLREDRDFHTVQTVEAALRQFEHWGTTEAGVHVLVAAARYLAAHSPTVRAQGQTYEIAYRLHRGDRIFEGE
ncbi:MAG TPA: Rieske (2Fe-2S) protein [Candidatus Binatia bacterium]|jgi:nitrite reductase/ring-hydroxylating ferredoxin subunit|nr:Rieske (2Fe-2S) protein [Candidatus Binatia bacterium]